VVLKPLHITITHQTAWSTYGIDQNQAGRFRISRWKAINGPNLSSFNFCEQVLKKGLDRGFNLEYVKDANGNAMSHGKPYHDENQFGSDETNYNLIFYQMVVQYQ
jgi:hypothetical protein